MSDRRFILDGYIGSGGFAWVFLATEQVSDGTVRQCVLKRLLPCYLFDRDVLRAFLDEADLGLLLRHPHIGRVYDLIDWNGCPAIALEHVDGPNLRELLQWCRRTGTHLSPAAAAYVVACVADALAYAWRASDSEGGPLQLIHRDLKPDNLMLTSSGSPRLLDFGIARCSAHTRTVTGLLKGTIPYMSPELARGVPHLTPASDVFSLGAVLFELLTDQRLFDAPDRFVCLRQVERAESARRLELLPNGALALRPVLEDMLRAAPEDRIPDAAALVRRLRGVRGDLAGAGGEAEELEALARSLGPRPVQRIRPEYLAAGPVEGPAWRWRRQRTPARVDLPELEEELEAGLLAEDFPGQVAGQWQHGLRRDVQDTVRQI